VLTTALAVTALAVALVALALTFTVMRQSGETTTDLRMHRRAHTIAHGHPDPKLDRRQVNLGPPRAGERRGATRYPEPRAHYAPRPVDPDLPSVEDYDPLSPDGVPLPPVRENTRTVEPDLPATGELEQTDLPTAMLEQQRPAPPRTRDGYDRP
jgi:hypothetical protein